MVFNVFVVDGFTANNAILVIQSPLDGNSLQLNLILIVDFYSILYIHGLLKDHDKEILTN